MRMCRGNVASSRHKCCYISQMSVTSCEITDIGKYYREVLLIRDLLPEIRQYSEYSSSRMERQLTELARRSSCWKKSRPISSHQFVASQ